MRAPPRLHKGRVRVRGGRAGAPQPKASACETSMLHRPYGPAPTKLASHGSLQSRRRNVPHHQIK